MKLSAVGGKAFITYDDVSSDWHPSGLAYDSEKDSLIALYRNSSQTDLFRMRFISKNFTGVASRDEQFLIDFMDPSYTGVYALEYHDANFYVLGVDTSKQDLLIRLDNQYNRVGIDTLMDSTVVGLCFLGNELFMSHRDQRIEFFASY